MSATGKSRWGKALPFLFIPLLIGVGTNLVTEDVPKAIGNPLILLPVLALLVILQRWHERKTTVSPHVVDDRAVRERILRKTRRLIEQRRRSSIDHEAIRRYDQGVRTPMRFMAECGADDFTDIDSSAALRARIVEELGVPPFLLVGEPGSGKTTVLLDLVEDLAREMEQRFRLGKGTILPVWLDLGLWRGESSFEEWLVKSLGRDFNVPTATAKQWVRNGDLFLVLDNVSWLPVGPRRECVRSIKQFLSEHKGVSLVVAANEEMIRPYGERFELPVIRVERLSEQEVIEYLRGFEDSHSNLNWLARSTPNLLGALRNRLFATVAIIAFDDANPVRMVDRPSTADARGAIIDGFVEYMLLRNDVEKSSREEWDLGSRANRLQFINYLAWIASNLVRLEHFYFWDWIDGSWLPRSSAKFALRLALGIGVGMLAGLILGSAVGYSYGMLAGYITGGLTAVGLFFSYRVSFSVGAGMTEPARTVRMRRAWSFETFRSEVFSKLGIVWTAGLAYFGYIVQGTLRPYLPFLSNWSVFSLRQQLLLIALLLVAGLAPFLFAWILGTNLQMEETDNPWVVVGPTSPGLFLVTGAKWALGAAVAVGATLVPAETVILAPSVFSLDEIDRRNELLLEIMRNSAGHVMPVSVAVGLLILLGRFGFLVETRVAEAILRRRQLVPNDYPKFLRYAARLSLLQRYGGGEYAFTHQVVRDRLATADGLDGAQGPNVWEARIV